jgi:hypothetical protein
VAEGAFGTVDSEPRRPMSGAARVHLGGGLVHSRLEVTARAILVSAPWAGLSSPAATQADPRPPPLVFRGSGDYVASPSTGSRFSVPEGDDLCVEGTGVDWSRRRLQATGGDRPEITENAPGAGLAPQHDVHRPIACLVPTLLFLSTLTAPPTASAQANRESAEEPQGTRSEPAAEQAPSNRDTAFVEHSTGSRSDEPTDVWERPLAVTGHFSIGGPIGTFGLELEWTPHPAFSVALGIGYSGSGPQAMGRVGLQATEGLVAVGFGVVGAVGPAELSYPGPLHFDFDYEGPSYRRRWDIATWIGGELHVAIRAPGGFTVRMYLGYTSNANPGDGVCTAGLPSDVQECEQQGTPAFPYTGVGIGYAW